MSIMTASEGQASQRLYYKCAIQMHHHCFGRERRGGDQNTHTLDHPAQRRRLQHEYNYITRSKNSHLTETPPNASNPYEFPTVLCAMLLMLQQR